MEDKREHERRKYEAIYAGECNADDPLFANYGEMDHWQAAWPLLKGVTSICDVGTGRGNLPRRLFSEGCRFAMGIDFAMPAHVQQRLRDGERQMVLWRFPAHDIPLPDASVELVTAFDLLEHLLPDEVDECLKEMRRVAKTEVLVSISYKPSRLHVAGETLHPTVQPKEWWKDRLKHCLRTEPQEWRKYLRCELNGLCDGAPDSHRH